MVVYDIILDGEVKETIIPSNQRLKEMYWLMVDQIPLLRMKYGADISIKRRFMQYSYEAQQENQIVMQEYLV